MPKKKMPENPQLEEHLPTAQDQTSKRRNIASRAADASTKLWDAVVALQQLSLERAQAGNFVSTDFDGTSLSYLTPFLVGLLLDTVSPAIVTFMSTALPSSGPVPRDIVLQMKP